MSQTRGKIPRDRKRRISAPIPYEIPSKASATMPTTRHSPARGSSASQGAQAEPPLSDVLRELTLLRQSMETKFLESGAKVDNLKTEVLAKLDDNNQAIAELQETVTDVTLSVDENQRAIQEVRAEAERREVQFPLRVKQIVQEALEGNRRPRPANTGVKPRHLNFGTDREVDADPRSASDSDSVSGDRKDESYFRARRSLRLWPISREGDLKDRTVEFLVNELLLDQQHAAGLDFEVRRVGSGRKRDSGATNIKDEVLVIFDSTRDRDDVRSFAKNLERRGRGLRLEVPDHLWSSFRVLQKVAYELKQKHPDLKRNVLFDDDARDLKLDVCIETEWKTIYPADARKSLTKMGKNVEKQALAASKLDELLASRQATPMDSEEY